MPSHIPEGFAALVPYLSLAGASDFVEFAKTAFLADVRMMHRDDAGNLVHGEIVVEGCVIELSEARDEWPAAPAHLHLYVPDPDATFARAVAAGARELYPMSDMDYGERSGGVEDRWGNHWYVAAVTDHAKRTMSA